MYVENSAEYLGTRVISLLNAFSNGPLLYVSPAVLLLLLSRTPDSTASIFKLTMGVITIYTSGIILRGYGRRGYPDYVDFYRTYKTFMGINWLENSAEKTRAKMQLMRYDFEFDHFPCEFTSSTPVVLKYNPPANEEAKINAKLVTKLNDLIAYIAVITIGRRMLYPGSVWLFQQALNPMLQKGRTRMVERLGGERFKIRTCDHNYIDTFLVDRRNYSHNNGKTLVICCEGNAGFYEMGVMCTPLDGGYSVMGWNHPGFAASTGLPFREQEIAAIDAVVRFALSKGFEEKDIILFGWSIGGFPASIAAMQYPQLGGVILDASFDDVLPLARSKMPSSWRSIVEHTIRSYFNLNVSENLSHFNGPVLIVRRIQDEIIFTLDSDPVRTNRANDILIKLLRHRFPRLFEGDAEDALRDFLRGPTPTSTGDHWYNVLRTNELKYVDDPIRRDEYYQMQLHSYIKQNNVTSYPVEFDSPSERTQFLLFLAEKHFKNHDSTHCMPLPSSYCVRPWDLFALSYPSFSTKSGL